MKDEDIKILLTESIKLEKNMSELYLLFASYFEDDKDFWWQLCIEENNHAALLKSINYAFLPAKYFVKDLLADNVQKVQKDNLEFEKIIKDFTCNPPLQKEACLVAVRLENLATEFHYQRFMDKEGTENIASLFQKLNADDKDHSLRIQAHMQAKGYN